MQPPLGIDGRAEVDHHGRPPVLLVRRDRVGDAIGADLLRVVVEDRHAGAHPRLDHERVEPEVAPGHVAQRRGDPRHPGAHRDAVDLVVEGEPVEAEELLDHERELVGGALGRGGDAPVVGEIGPVEESDDGLGVAGVDREQHVSRGPDRCRGRGPSA